MSPNILINHPVWWLCVLLALTGCDGKAPANHVDRPASEAVANLPTNAVRIRPESRPYVVVETINPQPFSAAISAPGRVDFRAKAISSAGTVVAGRVSDVNVQIGDRVKSGQNLATLSSVEAARMRSEFNRAKAELARSEDRLRRQQEMQRTGVGLEVERIEAETQLRQSRADFERSQDDLRLLGDGVGEKVIIHAPLDGTVLRTHASVGAAVEPGAALFDLGEPSALWVVANVFEKDLALVEKEAEASIEISSLPKPIEGHVVALGAEIDPETRRAAVFIAPDAPHTSLRPGMYARVSIQAAGPKHIVLPTSAVLVKDGKRTIVYVETGDNLFEPRPVLVGQARDGYTPVIQGLSGGERVVISGGLLLDAEASLLL